jgi:hypothetical protein
LEEAIRRHISVGQQLQQLSLQGCAHEDFRPLHVLQITRCRADCSLKSVFGAKLRSCAFGGIFLNSYSSLQQIATMTSSAADLFMHPQSCVIEEIVDEHDAPASSSEQEPRHSLEPSAEAAEGTAAAEPTSTAEASQAAAAADAAASSSAAGVSAGEAAVSAADAVADAQPAGAPASSSSGSEEQQQDPQTQQLIAECERLKQEGNTLYVQGEYDGALQLYWQVRGLM